ncbi:MAG: amidohydrolase family protein [Candidatus Buchananbacteria bacterium]|nr:amidohydrolase family protein [Candidatus Buchananbacteria bacterium]
MIIDIHTHIYSEKDYKDYFKRAKNQVAKAIVLDYKPVSPGLAQLIKLSRQNPNIFIVPTIEMNKNISSQLKILEKYFQQKQIYGIKLYPGYEYFYPSDKKVWPIARLCLKYNKPLIFHSGDVYDPAGGALLKYAQPIHIDELAVKMTQCKIVISHFGFPRFMETANIVSKNDNVYTDISGTIDETSNQKEAVSLLSQYRNDLLRVLNYFPNIKSKIMFGTDYGGEGTPLYQIQPYINLVKQIFTAKEQRTVFYDLAEQIYFG